MRQQSTILWGDSEVPIITRRWKSILGRYATPQLHKGQHWWTGLAKDLGEVQDRRKEYTQYYALLETINMPADVQPWDAVISYPRDRQHGVKYVPAEIAIARELKQQGADAAVWSEVWSGKRVFIAPDLICIDEIEPVHDLLTRLRAITGRRLVGGLPDVIACFADGRVAMREAKHVSSRYKDRLGLKQHDLARAAQRLLKEKLDLAVVEWGFV
jgi:hypothetical protein